jgi:nicotinate-nucleotide adenylyltransferase
MATDHRKDRPRCDPNQPEPGREIALLGGSFNPPHVAHAMAAYWVLATQRVSAVWLLPSYKHPFGKELAAFEHRVRMCELAIAHVRGAHVCTVEAELAADPLVGRTVRVLERLREKHPASDFALVLGTDVLAESHKWYRWDRVTQLARIIVIGRQGFPGTGGEPQLPNISSREIRERMARGENVSQCVARRVIEYARAHRLYNP